MHGILAGCNIGPALFLNLWPGKGRRFRPWFPRGRHGAVRGAPASLPGDHPIPGGASLARAAPCSGNELNWPGVPDCTYLSGRSSCLASVTPVARVLGLAVTREKIRLLASCLISTLCAVHLAAKEPCKWGKRADHSFLGLLPIRLTCTAGHVGAVGCLVRLLVSPCVVHSGGPRARLDGWP